MTATASSAVSELTDAANPKLWTSAHARPRTASGSPSCHAFARAKLRSGTFQKNRIASAVVIVASAMLGAGNGCKSMSHPADVKHAEVEWRQVRARLKHRLAAQHYSAGRFDETVEVIAESLSLDPRQPNAYVLLANANLERGDLAAADLAVRAAWSIGVDAAGLHFAEGVLLEQREEQGGALTEYAQAFERDPRPEFLSPYVECLVGADRLDEAQDILSKNARIVDTDATLSVIAARLALLRENLQDAAECYRRALVAQPECKTIERDLGLVLARSGRCDEASSPLEAALIDCAAWNHHCGAVRRTLAGCCLAMGQPEKAVELLQAYVETHPVDHPAMLILAKSAVAAGDLITGARAIDLARSARPDDAEVGFMTAVIEWRRGRLRQATDAIAAVLAVRPDDADAICLLGEVLTAQGRETTPKRCSPGPLPFPRRTDGPPEGSKRGLRPSASRPKAPPNRQVSPRIGSETFDRCVGRDVGIEKDYQEMS